MGIVNWKYILIEGVKEDRGTPQDDKTLILPVFMPWRFKSMTFAVQANTACMWAEVDNEVSSRWYRIAAVSTGKELPDNVSLGSKLGQCALTIDGRTVPTSKDNSVKHFYLIEETEREAVSALAVVPPLGPKRGEVIEVPLWFQAAAGNA